MLDDGAIYLDVRTIEEFEDGHIPDAMNIPFALSGPRGNQPNTDFVTVVVANFEKDQTIILGCKSGIRSAQALIALKSAGFSNLSDMSAGFVGKKDAFGQVTPGWMAEGREVEMETDCTQTYEQLRNSPAR